MLQSEQLALIAEHDCPVPASTGSGVTLLRNRDEQDSTIRTGKGQTRIFKRFRARPSQRPYLYDAVSGRVTPCSELAWRLLDEPSWTSDALRARFADISEVELEEALLWLHETLQPTDVSGFRFPSIAARVTSADAGLIRTLVVNVTEQCNLRCTYCYFSGGYADTRLHRSEQPTEATLRSALDRFLEHHDLCGGAQRAIYLFGGEPLLQFRLIRFAVEYLEARATEMDLDIANVIVQIATNGMLLNERIATFLVDHGIYLNISIDGPNHDRHRINAKGRGSLAKVIEKVEWLATRYPDYFRAHVGLVCVVAPPVDIDELYEFFTTWWPAQHALHLDFDLILAGGEVGYHDAREQFSAAKARLWDEFVAIHRKPAAERNKSAVYCFTTGFNFLHRAYHRVLTRDESPRPHGQLTTLLGTQGPPGVFLALVGADGTLYASYEYQSRAFRVGTVNDGLDAASVLEIMRNFRDAANASSCRTCWAARLCNVDYPDAYIDGADDRHKIVRKLQAKAGRCMAEREDLTNALSAEQSIIERYGTDALVPDIEEWVEQLESQRPEIFARV